ncbi:MAG: arabinose operon transcriptional regulator AraC [Planctomycetes bacterium]|nr:arabinose operon transcriptional regulator AraC [Planctomycetota bacterium]
MAQRLETEALPITKLVSGHFHSGPDYACWRSHGTRDWMLTYTIGGLGRYGHALGEIIVQPGELVLVRPGTLHDYGVEPRRQSWHFLWVHFHPRPEWIEWLAWPEEAPGLMRLDAKRSAHRARIAKRFHEVHALATGSERRREEHAMNALEEVLLWCDGANRAERTPLDARLKLAMDHCCRHLSERITLDTLARVSGLSPSRLSYLFQTQAGDAPIRYLERQRLARAKDLLEVTADPVKEVAAHVGFDDPFYFSVRFRRLTGLSPRAFRKRALAGVRRSPRSPR